jgi:cytoskeleton protein RodZ
VEISALNGNKLVSRLMRAGTTERFDVSEPVILVVGNASGVEANLRGQPLNLRAVARDNVSKLSLK